MERGVGSGRELVRSRRPDLDIVDECGTQNSLTSRVIAAVIGVSLLSSVLMSGGSERIR